MCFNFSINLIFCKKIIIQTIIKQSNNGKIPEFAKENDFLLLLSDIPNIDPADPRNIDVTKIKV